MPTRDRDYVAAWIERKKLLLLWESRPTPGQIRDLAQHRQAIQRFAGKQPPRQMRSSECHCGSRRCPNCWENRSLYYEPKCVGFKQR